MKKLSPRASNYLKNSYRDPNAIIDRTTLVNFFAIQEIPIFEPVIDFGMQYSGFILQTKTKKSDTFSAMLVSTQDIDGNNSFDYERQGENYLFCCGSHDTAQFNFYINQFGQFCSDGYKGGNILSSSFKIEIEQYALRDELSDWKESPYYELEQNNDLDIFLNGEFEIIQECSDSYNSWFASDNIIIQKGVWLHEPSSYLHFWGKSNDEIKFFVNNFQSAGIIN